VPGQEVTPITTMTLSSDAPSTVESAIASGRNGMTRNQSVSRSRIAPTQVPKWPDAMPTMVPIAIEITVAAKPTSNEMRAPQTTRARTERPVSSVPSQ
jgi:hypothetical protein